MRTGPGKRNAAFLVVTTTLALPYVLLPVATGLVAPGPGLLLPGTWPMLVVWALPLSYPIVLWRRWRVLVPLDYLIFVGPLATWLSVAIILKLVVWELTDGRAVLGPYGRDKGMSNAVFESTIVLVLSGVYLLTVRGAVNTRDMKVSRHLLTLSMGLAALVAALFPPLRD